MNRDHIELLTDYADFEEENPGSSLDDFYRHMASRQLKKIKQPSVPDEHHARLMRCISRLFSAYNIYLRTALRTIDMPVPEGFPFLASLFYFGKMRRTDLIGFTLTELSTGSEILNRLKKHGWITEQQDAGDKRVKIVAISEKGKKILKPCLDQAQAVRKYMFKGLTADEIKACVTALEPVEEQHSRMAVAAKGKME